MATTSSMKRFRASWECSHFNKTMTVEADGECRKHALSKMFANTLVQMSLILFIGDAIDDPAAAIDMLEWEEIV